MIGKVTTLGLAMFALVSCGGNTKEGGSPPKLSDILTEQSGQNGRACVRVSDIKGYGYSKGVLTIDGRRDYFLATTVMRCHSLDMAVGVAFDGPQNEICGGGNSYIQSKGGRCIISKIFEYDNRKAAFSALDEAKKIQSESTPAELE